MAFTVEDGTGLAAANSYISVADAGTYFADRGTPTAWLQSGTQAKERALVKATQYIDSFRRFPYRGAKATAAQRLQWPRAGASERHGQAIASDVVPAAVAEATAAVAALIIAGTDVQPILERGGAVRREKVDVIETEYFEGAPVEDWLLDPLDKLAHLVRTDGVQAPAPALKQRPVDEAFKPGTFDNPSPDTD